MESKIMMRDLEEELAAEFEDELTAEYEDEWEDEFETASGAQYEVIGRRDTRVRVRNTTLAPFRYICHLEYDGQAHGSGTLIGPSTVLTAGHCVSGFTASRMRIIPGRNGALEPLPATRASAFVLPAGYAAGTRTDYGIIHLTNAIGSKVGCWTRAHSRSKSDPTGTSISAKPLPMPTGVLRVNLSGYPGDKFYTTGKPPRKIYGTQQYRAYDCTVRERDGLLFYLNDTFAGHSGSPVWVRRHWSMGGRVMVGIHIGGAGSANAAVRINQTVLDFIIRNTK
jgi:V8-like Glu-specific endopeptidase